MTTEDDPPPPSVSNSADGGDGMTSIQTGTARDITIHNADRPGLPLVAIVVLVVAGLVALVAIVWVTHDSSAGPTAVPVASPDSPRTTNPSASTGAATTTMTMPTSTVGRTPPATTPGECADGHRVVVTAPPHVDDRFPYSVHMNCPPVDGQEYRMVIEFPAMKTNGIDHSEWYARAVRFAPDQVDFSDSLSPSGPGSTRLIYVISCYAADYDEWAASVPVGAPITGSKWPGTLVSEPASVLYRP